MTTYARASALASLLLVAATVAAQPGAPADSAEALLARARRRLSQSKTYQATIVTRTTVGSGAETTSRLIVKLKTGRKAHVRIEPQGLEFWHDGRSLTRYDRRAGVYTRLRADDSSAPLMPQAYLGLASGGTCRRVRTESQGGRRVEVLLMIRSGSGQRTQARATTLLHIDAKSFRVLGYRSTSPGPENGSDEAPIQISTRGHVASETLNAPIPDSEFVFRSPRGAHLDNSGDTR